MGFSHQKGRFRFAHFDAKTEPTGEEMSGFHSHGEFELLYVLSGNAEIDIRSRHYRIRPFSLILIKPGEPHNFRIDPSRPCNRYLIHFPKGGVPASFLATLQSLASIYLIPGTRLSEEIGRMDAYCQDIDAAHIMDVLTHHLSVILGYACNFSGMRNEPLHTDVDAEYIISHINRNLTSIHSISDISRLTRVSPSSIKKLVSGHIHQPVMHYVRTQKCLLAQTLLARGHTAAQVCYQCGFKNYSTFYRAYLKTCGEIPSAGGKAREGDGVRV